MKKRNWVDKALTVAVVAMIVFLILGVISASARYLSLAGAAKDWRWIGFVLSWLAIWILYTLSNETHLRL